MGYPSLQHFSKLTDRRYVFQLANEVLICQRFSFPAGEVFLALGDGFLCFLSGLRFPRRKRNPRLLLLMPIFIGSMIYVHVH